MAGAPADWAAAAAGSSDDWGRHERGAAACQQPGHQQQRVEATPSEPGGRRRPGARRSMPSISRHRLVPSISVRTLNTVFPEVTYRVRRSGPPNAAFVIVSSGIGMCCSSSPAGEMT